MNDITIPDRLSTEKRSPYGDLTTARRVRVFLNDHEQRNVVVEYCISEGWIRRYASMARQAIEKVYGIVRVEWRAPLEMPVWVDEATRLFAADTAKDLAAAKRARKAAKRARDA